MIQVCSCFEIIWDHRLRRLPEMNPGGKYRLIRNILTRARKKHIWGHRQLIENLLGINTVWGSKSISTEDLEYINTRSFFQTGFSLRSALRISGKLCLWKDSSGLPTVGPYEVSFLSLKCWSLCSLVEIGVIKSVFQIKNQMCLVHVE